MRRLFGLYLFLAAVTFWPALAAAQPVPSRDPDTTHLFPAGGRRGSTVKLHVGTECFPPGARLKFYGQGIHAAETLETEVEPGSSAYAQEPSPRRKPEQVPISYPRQWQAELKIDALAEPGLHLWRATCAQGGSRARVFVVGDLPEFIETESNSTAERAERVELPVTINGRIAGERDLDYYIFTAAEGQTIHCEMLAAGLGSPLDPVVSVMDESGRRLPVQETQLGVDAGLSVRIPRDGDYRLLISNVSLHGGPNYVYRATLTTDRRPWLAFPAGGRTGSTAKFELLSPDGNGAWVTWQEQLKLPSIADSRRFAQLRSGESTICIEVGDYPELIESDERGAANNIPGQAELLTLPQTIDGRFASTGDEDWFRFSATKGQQVSLHAQPAPLASRATPTLEVFDTQRKSLKQASAYETPDGDCHLDWKCPADGEYLVRLRDARHGFQGGPQFIYRFTIALAKPDFELSFAQDQLNLTPSGKATLTLEIRRQGSFQEAIAIECSQLPAGVTFEPHEVPRGKTSVKLTFSAAEDARPADVSLQVRGAAKVGEEEFRHTAQVPHTGQDAAGLKLDGSALDTLFLTVRHKPVFRLYCAEAYLYAHRGMVFPYAMQIERLDDYQGEIILQSGDRQNRDLDGVDLQRYVVPLQAVATHMPILLPESMHANVQSQSQLYVQGYTRFVDRWGDAQSLLVVSEKRCMLRTLPSVVKLKASVKSVASPPGRAVSIPLVLKRTSNFPGSMRLELVEAPQGVTIRPNAIKAGEEEVQVQVTLPADLDPRSQLRLQFRATGNYPGHLELISETAVDVVLQ